MRPRVFVLEPTRHELSTAERYGEVVYALPRGARAPSIWAGDYADAVLDRLDEADYDPRVDYFCVAGSVVPVTQVVAALASIYDKFQVLFFDASRGGYAPKTLGRSTISQET